MSKATARTRWRTYISSISHRSNVKRFWNTIRSLSGKRAKIPPNQPISFSLNDGPPKTCTKPTAVAKYFNKQFTSVTAHSRDPDLRHTLRRVKRTHNLDHSYTPFTAANTAAVIHQCKNSTATGPDGLTILHLKKLGPTGIQYLSHIFNLSLFFEFTSLLIKVFL